MVVWTLETSDSTTGANRVFLPQFNRGFVVSGAQNIHKNSIFVRKDATSELDFEAENLHFHYKMWSNETALKQRKKTIFEPLGRAPVTEIRRNWRKIWSFKPVSTAIFLWDAAKFTLLLPTGELQSKDSNLATFLENKYRFVPHLSLPSQMAASGGLLFRF